MSVFEAVEVREQLSGFDSDILQQLESRYLQHDRKQVQCKACSMVLLKGDREEIASHFAFSHTDDMKRILKDRTPV